MKKFRGLGLLLLIALVGPAVSAEDTKTDCQLGGWSVGVPFLDHAEDKKFSKSKTKFYRPAKNTDLYRVDIKKDEAEDCSPEDFRLSGGTSCSDSQQSGNKKGQKDYVAVREGVVIAVVREFPPEETQKYIAALVKRYGDPASTPNSDSGIDGRSLGSLATINERTVWLVEACGAVIEIVQRTKILGTMASQKSALVITEMQEPDDILD